MTFTVYWSKEAESRLAYEWLISTDRRRLSAAADRVDAMLRRDAHLLGESRSENRRIVHEPPLGIVFSADLENRKVLVLDLWCYELYGK